MGGSRANEPASGALQRALTVQRDAAQVGFDWPEIAPVFDKVLEEIDEIREALARGNSKDAQDELGDLLFAVVNLSRFLHADPADALNRTTDRFQLRFSRVLELVAKGGKLPQDCTLQELDAAWETAKKESLSPC